MNDITIPPWYRKARESFARRRPATPWNSSNTKSLLVTLVKNDNDENRERKKSYLVTEPQFY